MVSMDLTLLSVARNASERSEMPDLVHASDTFSRTMVVWRSIASVTTAGEGGNAAAKESGERAGVRVATAVDAGV